MNDQLEKVRQRHLTLMEQSCALLGHILSGVSPETATTLRDEPDGWTVLEVVCHLRDYDRIFQDRVVMMLEQDHPALPHFDHEALAVERHYNNQNLSQVYSDLRQSRAAFIELFARLNEAQWQRSGVHPERGHFTMLDAAVQVGTHEVNHLEQITRILSQKANHDKRVKFDFEIEFTNGGGLQGQDFRLDIFADDISDKDLAGYLVKDMRLLMVGQVRILNKEIITEKHKR